MTSVASSPATCVSSNSSDPHKLCGDHLSRSLPCVGLIINDGKDLALSTADTIEARLKGAGYDVVRASSAAGMVGFANPEQHLRSKGHVACVPPNFEAGMDMAMVLGAMEPCCRPPG